VTVICIQLLCFWALSIALFLFKTHNVSEAGLGILLQVEPTQMGPIDRATPYLRQRQNQVSEKLLFYMRTRIWIMSRKTIIVYNSALIQKIRIPRLLSQAIISNHSNIFTFMVYLAEARESKTSEICNIIRSENNTSVFRPKICMHFSTFPSMLLYSVT
jgi:hypothetical protein